MASIILPFAEEPNSRDFRSLTTSSKDQRLISAISTPYKNGMYVEKRPGWEEAVAAGISGYKGIAVYTSPATSETVYVVLTSTSPNTYTVFENGINCGEIFDSAINNITEIIIGSISYYLLGTVNSAASSWFLASNANSQTSYTGDTHSNTTIDNIASTTGMYAGQLITGSGIPASTRIASVDSSTAITITQAATSTSAGVTLTKTPVAKIIDSDYPTDFRGNFVVLNGTVYVLTASGTIRNSDLNSVTSWPATGTISTNFSSDDGLSLTQYKNYIIAFGKASMEVFYDAGNPVGSPLARYDQATSNIGLAWGISAAGFDITPIASRGDILCYRGVMHGTTEEASIYVLDDLVPRKISTPWIDRALGRKYVTLDLIPFNGQLYLHAGVGNHTALTGSYLYSFETNMWMESGWPYYFRINQGAGRAIAVAINSTSGKAYTWGGDDSVVWRDETSTSYTMTIQMDKWDAGTNKRKFLNRIELLGADIQSSGSTTLEISVDDYTSWTTIGTFDNTVIDPYLENCGSFVGAAAFRVTNSDNTAWRAKGLKIYYSIADEAEEQNG